MSPDMIRAIAELAWPIMAVGLLWRLYPLIKEIARSRAFTLKVAGMEISAQQASEQLQDQIDDLRTKLSEIRTSLNSRDVPRPQATPSPGRRILWVDDVPANNAYAIAQLTARGLEVLQALSTAEAMRHLSPATPGVAAVISDMGREEGGTYKPDAGLELLKAMRQDGYMQPFIICTTGRAAAHYNAIVRAAGGAGATNSFVEIFDFIQAATGAA